MNLSWGLIWVACITGEYQLTVERPSTAVRDHGAENPDDPTGYSAQYIDTLSVRVYQWQIKKKDIQFV